MGDRYIMQSKRPDKTLTAQFVRTVKIKGKYFDGHGLFLRVNANGSKQWVQRITIRGKRSELGLGNPALVSLSDAREHALSNRKLAQSGGDPIQAKREHESVFSFEEAARQVYEMRKPTWSNPKHAKQFISTLETYVFPFIGKIRISEISTNDILKVLNPIWLTKHETATRVRQRMGVVIAWAIAKGWRQDNPADAILAALPKSTQKVQHFKSLDYRKVSECINSIKTSNAGISTKLGLEFLILTATRSSETRLANWSDFDLKNGIWTIPANKIKGRKTHRIPISKRMLEILMDAKNVENDSGFVFPGYKKGRPLSDATFSKLVKKLGYDADIHGFRTSFRVWAQEQTNFDNRTQETALSHSIKDKAEAAYARSDLFEKRRLLMEAWAIYLELKTAEVVKLA